MVPIAYLHNLGFWENAENSAETLLKNILRVFEGGGGRQFFHLKINEENYCNVIPRQKLSIEKI